MNLFQRKSVYIITGASRGLGKSIAINFAKKSNEQSVFILLSRDMEALEAVKSEVYSSRPKMKVVAQQFDQGDLDEKKMENIFDKIFSENNLSKIDYDQAVIIHNAGTLGDNSKLTRDLKNVSELNTYFAINLTGVVLLNSAFLNFFTHEQFPLRYLVNISSLTAIEPYKTLSLYCTGKAAREMFFKVIALEEPSVRILNYAPGPCETDMQRECRENSSDSEVKQLFQSIFDEGKVLKCDTSIEKLVQLLEADTFVSGSHIDFFDI